MNKEDKEALLNELSVCLESYFGLITKHRATITESEAGLCLDIEFPFPIEDIESELKSFLVEKLSLDNSLINLSTNIKAHVTREGLLHHPKIKNIIAVSSAKGGVGKSTTAVNFALALKSAGAKVGILDADIYGPSQPHLLGTKRKADTVGKKILPVISHGIPSISIGYLVDDSSAMIWRGPMVSGALKQLLNDTEWSELDYLIMDLPPGTGDIQLTLVQNLPLTAAIVVTTPQDIAMNDARRGLQMFKKVSVPVLGIVENMAVHTCSGCGKKEHIFGGDLASKIVEDTDSTILGSLPLDIRIREHSDIGIPIVVADEKSDIALEYIKIARAATMKLSTYPRNLRIKTELVQK